MIKRIISGGQTGADQGGWLAAKSRGISTGGWMPKGFKTEDGARPEFADIYGAKEHPSGAYPPRTYANVKESDATVWFGSGDSRGFACTEKATLSVKSGHPFLVIVSRDLPPEKAAAWLNGFQIQTLNVAGNRESRSTGIGQRVQLYLLRVFDVINPPTKCANCGENKVPGTECHGDDDCCHGPGGGHAECCEGWGRYCCRCGADFARGQM